MNFWRKTLNSRERSQPLRGPQQITFIMRIRFWSLSKKSFIPLFLTDNIKLDEIPTKIKLKIQACFTLYLSFEKVLVSNVIRCSYQFFYFLFCINFYIRRYHFFMIFQNFIQRIHANLPPPQQPKSAKHHKTFLANFP